MSVNKYPLQQLLQNYSSIYPKEQITKERMLEFLKHCPDCFDRSCHLGHFTASSWLLNHDCSKFLLMYHAKFNKWCQLGGHCDGNDNVLEVAIKEAKEESGITNIIPVLNNIFDLDILIVPKFKQEPVHYHFDITFLLKTTSSDDFI